jgi:hypothetical protein
MKDRQEQGAQFGMVERPVVHGPELTELRQSLLRRVPVSLGQRVGHIGRVRGPDHECHRRRETGLREAVKDLRPESRSHAVPVHSVGTIDLAGDLGRDTR